MSTVPLEVAPFVAMIDEWLDDTRRGNPVILAIDSDPEANRWYVRMRGEEKSVTTVWLTLRERTLHSETYFMPAPEENVEACLAYLLRTNKRLFGCKFSIGPEDAVYLTGQLPLSALQGSPQAARSELDRVLGTAYAYSEECFRTAMQIGFESRFRR